MAQYPLRHGSTTASIYPQYLVARSRSAEGTPGSSAATLLWLSGGIVLASTPPSHLSPNVSLSMPTQHKSSLRKYEQWAEHHRRTPKHIACRIDQGKPLRIRCRANFVVLFQKAKPTLLQGGLDTRPLDETPTERRHRTSSLAMDVPDSWVLQVHFQLSAKKGLNCANVNLQRESCRIVASHGTCHAAGRNQNRAVMPTLTVVARV